MYRLVRKIVGKRKNLMNRCNKDTYQFFNITKEQAKTLLKRVNKTLRNVGLNGVVVNKEEVNGNTVIDYITKLS